MNQRPVFLLNVYVDVDGVEVGGLIHVFPVERRHILLQRFGLLDESSAVMKIGLEAPQKSLLVSNLVYKSD